MLFSSPRRIIEVITISDDEPEEDQSAEDPEEAAASSSRIKEETINGIEEMLKEEEEEEEEQEEVGDVSGQQEQQQDQNDSKASNETKRDSWHRAVRKLAAEPAKKTKKKHTGKKASKTWVDDILKERIRTMPRKPRKWVKAVEKLKEDDPEDEKLDLEVLSSKEVDYEHWEALAKKMYKRNETFHFDYIVAADKDQEWMLVKWSKFAIPTWISKDQVDSQRGRLILAFEKRAAVMAAIEARIRSEMEDPSGFEKKYPHRWLEWEEGVGESQYVGTKEALAVNNLRAWEWRVNYDNDKKGLGIVYIENWVDDAEFPDIEFITANRPSLRVSSVLENTNELAFVTCGEECSKTCSYPSEHFHKMAICCGVLYGAVYYYREAKSIATTRAETHESSPFLTILEIESMVLVECSPECKCAGTSCRQRLVQKGRQTPLVIFREDAERGWGVRAADRIARGAFVSEYVGEVLTGDETDGRSGSHYQFCMRYGWTENLDASTRVRNVPAGGERLRRHRPFTVDASRMGNEARFINHSCEPNLAAVTVFVERHGEFYHRIALFARREIAAGEELSFDYFPTNDSTRAWKAMFKSCRCGTASCKFAKKEEGEDEETEEEEDDEDEAAMDSFESDDDVYRENKRLEEKRKALKKKRADERRRRKKREEEGEEKERSPSPSENDRRGFRSMRRGPDEINKERYEDFPEKLSKFNGGIFQFAEKKPWSPEEYDSMLVEARRVLAERKQQQQQNEN